MKNVKLIVAIVGLVIAAYLIVKAVTPDSTGVGLVVQCDECGKAYKIETNLTDDSFPMKCKFCKKKSVYRLLYCKDCLQYFTHHPGDGISCPYCGSINLGQPEEVPE